MKAEAMKDCSLPECTAPALWRGMCRRHYDQWRKWVGPIAPPTSSALPNPWWDEAPACPRGCPPLRVYLWAAEGTLRWLCAEHQLRFDAPTSQVPCGVSGAEGTLVVGSVDSP